MDTRTPRGARTAAVLPELEGRVGDVRLITGKPLTNSEGGGRRTRSSPVRRLASRAAASVLIDRHEPWSRRHVPGSLDGVTGALLIGFPWSPIALAAPQLAAKGVPYVIDVGDPWVLTSPRPAVGGFALRRAKRAERAAWEGAAGAIVTTEEQAARLTAIVPRVPVLVRPNGVWPPTAEVAVDSPRHAASRDVLRVVHFGSIYESRVSIMPFLERLASSGSWKHIELRQFGADWTGELKSTAGVSVRFEEEVPWDEAYAVAESSDVALVISNSDPAQLPSKVVTYLTLPIPRLAVVAGVGAVDRYVADKEGWLVLSVDESRPGRAVASLVEKCQGNRLSLPHSETWAAVCETIVDFIVRVLSSSEGNR